jgi:hypothetical protein
MTGINGFDSFLSRIGPLAAEDHARQRTLAAEEAPEFHALSFFHSREEIDSQMIAYLLNPTSQHGQGSLFLTALLTVLGVTFQELRAVVVEIEAPCYSLPSKRRIDILIRFATGAAESVIVIESKSRFAGDQNNQVHDYLVHLRGAFPNASRRYLYYLKDGNPPSKESIVAEEWNAAVSAGICTAANFREVMSDWLAYCEKKQLPSKIKVFLKDFKHFIGLDEESATMIGNGVRDKVLEIIERRGAAPENGSSDFDAVLAIYGMHDQIWQRAIEECVRNVRKLLMEQLPGWESKGEFYFEGGDSYFELVLWNAKGWTTSDGEPNLSVVVASEDLQTTEQQRQGYRGPTYLEMYVHKTPAFSPEGAEFNHKNIMVIGPGKNTYTKRLQLSGVEDVRSAEGVRYLLTSQGAMDISSEIVRFVSDHERKMDECFGVNGN